jgi:carboxypeptidase family protein
MSLRLLIVVLLAALTAPNQVSQRTPDEPEAEVTGTVTDRHGRYVDGARLLFVSGDRRTIVQTTDDGTYTIRLVPGIYVLRVMDARFCESRRGEFALKAEAQVRFDFDLVDCDFVDYFFPGHRAEDPYPVPPRQPGEYGEEELKAVSPAGLRPLVMYGDRKEEPVAIHYSFLVHAESKLPVVFTYDLLTIKADNLTYYPKDGSIEAVGNVTWQDGHETRLGSRATVSFRSGEPIVSLTK